MPTLSNRLRATALRLLADMVDAGEAGFDEVVVADDGREVLIVIRPHGANPPESAAELKRRIASLSKPTPNGAQQRVLDVLDAQKSSKGISIAGRLGLTYCGGFRQMLSDMVKAGFLVKDKAGYKRATS